MLSKGVTTGGGEGGERHREEASSLCDREGGCATATTGRRLAVGNSWWVTSVAKRRRARAEAEVAGDER